MLTIVSCNSLAKDLNAKNKHSHALLSKYSKAELAGKDLKVLFSLVWEGFSVPEGVVEKVLDFRQKYPDVVFSHMIDPNVFSVMDKTLILKLIKDGDIIGQHLHPWKQTLKSVGLENKNLSSVWGRPISLKDCDHPCGYEGSLKDFTESELVHLIHAGKLEIRRHIGRFPDVFMSPSWYLSEKLSNAMAKNAIKYDASPIGIRTLRIIQKNYNATELAQQARDGWQYFQQISNQSVNQNSISFLPQNGGNLDMIQNEDLKKLLVTESQRFLNRKKVFIHFTAFLESSWRNVGKWENLLILLNELKEGYTYRTVKFVDRKDIMRGYQPIEEKSENFFWSKTILDKIYQFNKKYLY